MGVRGGYLRRGGFTIVELLVVIAIVGILMGLGGVIWTKVQRSGEKAGAVANMRQLGTAIQSHAIDHDGAFPGPLWPGQIPVYDPDRDGRLAGELVPYLDVQEGGGLQVVDLLVPPAFRRVMPPVTPDTQPRTYVMNLRYELNGIEYLPFGDLTMDPPATPMKQGAIPGRVRDFWVLSDADQQHPLVEAAPWAGETAEEPIHDDVRAVLFLDGRVEMKPLEWFDD